VRVYSNDRENTYVAACCSVLRRVAVCCSVLHRVAACCSVLQRVAACCSVLDENSGGRGRPFVDIPMNERMHLLQCVALCGSQGETHLEVWVLYIYINAT